MMREPKKIFYLLILGASLFLQSFDDAYIYLPYFGENPKFYKAYDYNLSWQPIITNPIVAPTIKENQDNSGISLDEFAQSLVNGQEGIIRGLYLEGKFSYQVVQQPNDDAAFVSTMEDVVTEFSMAKKYGVTGLLAHNFLAGADFFSVEIGDLIHVVYGNGEILTYKVVDIQSYQALSPNSASSNFVDLETSENLAATQLFKRVYMGGHHLTLQTCIQQDGEDSWGRLFIIADSLQSLS